MGGTLTVGVWVGYLGVFGWVFGPQKIKILIWLFGTDGNMHMMV